MEYKIYSQAGILKTSFDPGSSTHVHEAMVDNVLNLSFTLNEYVSLDVNDYIDINADRFTLLEPYKPVVKNTKQYEYSVKFYGAESIAKKAQLVDENYEPITAYYDTPSAQLQYIVNCINRVVGSNRYSVGAVVSSAAISVDYASGTNCFAALSVLAEAVGTEWWLDGIAFNLTKCEHSETITLGYGAGLLSLDKEINSDSSFFTRLIPLGSTKNIVKSTYGYSRLQLPGGIKYVDQNVSDYGIVEKVIEDAFADIYPRYTGNVGTVRTETKTIEGVERTIYYFKDTTMGFNPNDYAVAGLVKHVVFKSGDLNGRDFEANWYPSTGEWELINQYPDESTQVPGGNVIPRTGDTYTIYNIEMPAIYRTNAEAEYLAAVQAYLAKYAIDFSIYKAPTDHVYLEDNNITLTLGRRVKLVSDKYFTSGSRDSRITKITRKLSDLNQMDIEVSNVISKGQYSQLQDDLSNLKTAVKEQLSTEILQIIKSFSVGDLTDDNVLSSLRVLKEIKDRALSKTEADTAQELITFLEGLIADDIKSKQYSSGALGSGMRFWMQDGKSYGELDNLTVRMETVFRNVMISEAKHIGGELISSSASMLCNKVEDYSAYYRCFFDRGENNESHNEFIVDDQARCQIFTGSNSKYYWRRVISVGDDYIDISKTDCDGTGVPTKGDTIYQLGYKGTDKPSRQCAQIFSCYGVDAPSYKQYVGINSYSLDGKYTTGFTSQGNKIKGDIYIESGESVAAKFGEVETLIDASATNLQLDYNAKLEVLDDSITSKVAETKTYADNAVADVQVGGRNLIINSGNWDNLNNWQSNGSTMSIVNIDGANCMRLVGLYGATQLIGKQLKPNTEYTFSAYIRSDQALGSGGDSQLHVQVWRDEDIENVHQDIGVSSDVSTTANVWKLATHTFRTPNSSGLCYCRLYFYPLSTGTVDIRYCKLEVGNKATDWTPAIEDMAGKSWIEQNYSTETQTAANIALEIGKVQFGGRNLIKNSSSIKNIGGMFGNPSSQFTPDVADRDGTTNAGTITFATSNDFFRIGNASVDSPLPIHGNSYTYSVWVYPLTGTQIKLSISAFDPVLFNLVANKWQRLSVTATMIDGEWYDAWRFVDIKGVNAGDSFKIYHPQVEIGNKVTDWSPSPDDFAAKDNILAAINLSQEGVKIKGDKISLEGTVTANDNFKVRIDGIIEAIGAILKGDITATSGMIGLLQIISGALIGRNSSGKECIRFTADPVPDISSLANSWESVLSSGNEYSEYTVVTDSNGDANFEGTPSGTATNIIDTLSSSFTLDTACYVKIAGVTNGATIAPNSNLSVSSSSVTVELYNVNTSTFVTYNLDGTTLVPAGRYSVHLRGSITLTDYGSKSTMYSIMQYVGFEHLEAQQPSARTYIGSDGFYSMFGANSFIWFKQGFGLVGKGPTNMPGVLASGSISSAGAQVTSKRWGAKADYVNDATLVSAGYYKVPINSSNANYTVNISPKAAQRTFYIGACTTSYFEVYFYVGGTLTNTAFDFQIIGSNE